VWNKPIAAWRRWREARREHEIERAAYKAEHPRGIPGGAGVDKEGKPRSYGGPGASV
jgi:hypothetical protein